MMIAAIDAAATSNTAFMALLLVRCPIGTVP
jgi:hypothetical protein